MNDIFSQMKCSLAQKMAETIEGTEFQKINDIISDFFEKDPEIHSASDTSKTATSSTVNMIHQDKFMLLKLVSSGF